MVRDAVRMRPCHGCRLEIDCAAEFDVGFRHGDTEAETANARFETSSPSLTAIVCAPRASDSALVQTSFFLGRVA